MSAAARPPLGAGTRVFMVLAVLLGGVLLVMVGEQAQEMHVVKWISTTNIPALNASMPDWLGPWFSVFPTVETLAGQALAAAVVVGSFFLAKKQSGQEAA